MARSSATILAKIAVGLAAQACSAGCVSYGGAGITPFNQGVDAFDTARYPDAVRFFSRAAELEPDDPRPLVNLGLTYDRIGNAKLAEKHYRGALKLNPEEPRALANLGQLLGERGKHPEARKLLELAVEVEPSSAAGWVALGWYEEGRKQLDAAEQHYLQAIEQEPLLSTGHYRLGALYAKQGKRDAALTSLREALEMEPEDVEAMRAVIALLPPNDPDGEAIGLMQRVLLVVPDDGGLWLTLGRAYMTVNDPERAALALWRARDLSKRRTPKRMPAIHAELRRVYAALGRALPADAK